MTAHEPKLAVSSKPKIEPNNGVAQDPPAAAKVPKTDRRHASLRDAVQTMQLLAQQNQTLMEELRAAKTRPNVTIIDHPEPAPAQIPRTSIVPQHVERMKTPMELRDGSRRPQKVLKQLRHIGGKIDALVFQRFHDLCYQKQIPVYEGLERAMSAWLELES